MEKNGELLRIVELRTYFYIDEGTARAVDGVSLEIQRGKTLGLVGHDRSVPGHAGWDGAVGAEPRARRAVWEASL